MEKAKETNIQKMVVLVISIPVPVGDGKHEHRKKYSGTSSPGSQRGNKRGSASNLLFTGNRSQRGNYQ